MGCWGMGLTQSDEYCEIYERFMAEYDEGKPVRDITNDILEECLDEFDENDGVLHDVYFALAKAEWMCGGISDKIYSRVRQIIENGENIVFYRELEAKEPDLKVRQKNLTKFLHSISSPREKARKRKIPEDKYVPQPKPAYPSFPKMHVGDVFAYKHGNNYRVFAIVRREKLYKHPAVYAYAWRKTFHSIPTLIDIAQEYVIPLGYFLGDTFPKADDILLIGNMKELQKLGIIYRPEFINPTWKPATAALAKAEHLTEEYPIDICMTVTAAIQKVKQLQEKISVK